MHGIDAFGNSYLDGGTVQVRVYDSPADRFAAGQPVSQGQ